MFLDIEGAFALNERLSSPVESLQDGSESLVALFGSGSSNENVVYVTDYGFNSL